MVDKIFKWVRLFVSVGDVAVNYDPTTAALPWAAVRFVLQAAISDMEVHGSIIADLAILSRFISRYREFEWIHLQQAWKSSIKDQMERALHDSMRIC